MFKVIKVTEDVGGSLKYQDGLIDKVFEDLSSQLNDKRLGVKSVCGMKVHVGDTKIHAVALVEVEEQKKK